MQLSDALALEAPELLALLGGDAKLELAYALGRELGARDRRVVTTATVPVPVPEARQCEAIVADPETEVVLRDTIERLKYFRHVTAGRGGTGGYVTTRVTGRRLRAVSDDFVHVLHRNDGIPFVVVVADERTSERWGDRDVERRLPSGTTLAVFVASVAGEDEPGELAAFVGDALGAIAPLAPRARRAAFLSVAREGAIAVAREAARRASTAHGVALVAIGHPEPDGALDVLTA